MKRLPLPYRERLVLVCTNRRPPEAERPSCGYHGGEELRERLKAEVKARGLKGRVMVVKTSCLGYCPLKGVVVGFPGGPEEEPRWLNEVDPEGDFDTLLELACGVGPVAGEGG